MEIKNVNKVHKEKLSRLDKIALRATNFVGSMKFFFGIVIWTVLWFSWNIFAPIEFRFDPFPAFVLWLFLSNMIQIFLMPLVMIGQNLQGRHSEERAENDYQVNLKAEQDIATILEKLEVIENRMK